MFNISFKLSTNPLRNVPQLHTEETEDQGGRHLLKVWGLVGDKAGIWTQVFKIKLHDTGFTNCSYSYDMDS